MSRGIAWLALLISVAALFLSWRAYERSGGRLEDLMSISVGEPEPEDWRQELDRTRERLLESRDELADNRNMEQLEEELHRMREDLERSLHNAGEDTRKSWREVDSDLERLQGQLRGKSSRAKETLDSAVEKMKKVGER